MARHRFRIPYAGMTQFRFEGYRSQAPPPDSVPDGRGGGHPQRKCNYVYLRYPKEMAGATPPEANWARGHREVSQGEERPSPVCRI